MSILSYASAFQGSIALPPPSSTKGQVTNMVWRLALVLLLCLKTSFTFPLQYKGADTKTRLIENGFSEARTFHHNIEHGIQDGLQHGEQLLHNLHSKLQSLRNHLIQMKGNHKNKEISPIDIFKDLVKTHSESYAHESGEQTVQNPLLFEMPSKLFNTYENRTTTESYFLKEPLSATMNLNPSTELKDSHATETTVHNVDDGPTSSPSATNSFSSESPEFTTNAVLLHEEEETFQTPLSTNPTARINLNLQSTTGSSVTSAGQNILSDITLPNESINATNVNTLENVDIQPNSVNLSFETPEFTINSMTDSKVKFQSTESAVPGTASSYYNSQSDPFTPTTTVAQTTYPEFNFPSQFSFATDSATESILEEMTPLRPTPTVETSSLYSPVTETVIDSSSGQTVFSVPSFQISAETKSSIVSPTNNENYPTGNSIGIGASDFKINDTTSSTPTNKSQSEESITFLEKSDYVSTPLKPTANSNSGTDIDRPNTFSDAIKDQIKFLEELDAANKEEELKIMSVFQLFVPTYEQQITTKVNESIDVRFGGFEPTNNENYSTGNSIGIGASDFKINGTTSSTLTNKSQSEESVTFLEKSDYVSTPLKPTTNGNSGTDIDRPNTFSDAIVDQIKFLEEMDASNKKEELKIMSVLSQLLVPTYKQQITTKVNEAIDVRFGGFKSTLSEFDNLDGSDTNNEFNNLKWINNFTTENDETNQSGNSNRTGYEQTLSEPANKYEDTPYFESQTHSTVGKINDSTTSSGYDSIDLNKDEVGIESTVSYTTQIINKKEMIIRVIRSNSNLTNEWVLPNNTEHTTDIDSIENKTESNLTKSVKENTETNITKKQDMDYDLTTSSNNNYFPVISMHNVPVDAILGVDQNPVGDGKGLTTTTSNQQLNVKNTSDGSTTIAAEDEVTLKQNVNKSSSTIYTVEVNSGSNLTIKSTNTQMEEETTPNIPTESVKQENNSFEGFGKFRSIEFSDSNVGSYTNLFHVNKGLLLGKIGKGSSKETENSPTGIAELFKVILEGYTRNEFSEEELQTIRNLLKDLLILFGDETRYLENHKHVRANDKSLERNSSGVQDRKKVLRKRNVKNDRRRSLKVRRSHHKDQTVSESDIVKTTNASEAAAILALLNEGHGHYQQDDPSSGENIYYYDEGEEYEENYYDEGNHSVMANDEEFYDDSEEASFRELISLASRHRSRKQKLQEFSRHATKIRSHDRPTDSMDNRQ